MDVVRSLQAGPYDESTLQRVRTSLGGLRRDGLAQEVEKHRGDVLGMLDEFGRAATSPVVASNAYLLAADLCDMMGDREATVEALIHALDADPSCRAAAQRLQAALPSDRDRPRLLALLSVRAQALGRMQPRDVDALADAHRQIGRVCADAGDLDRAIAAYENSREFKSDAETLELLAELHLQRQRPNDVLAAADLFCALHDLEGPREGRTYLHRALALVPSHGEAQRRLDEGIPNGVPNGRMVRQVAVGPAEPPPLAAADSAANAAESVTDKAPFATAPAGTSSASEAHEVHEAQAVGEVPTQEVPVQAVPTQEVPVQAVTTQEVPVQAVTTQPVPQPDEGAMASGVSARSLHVEDVQASDTVAASSGVQEGEATASAASVAIQDSKNTPSASAAAASGKAEQAASLQVKAVQESDMSASREVESAAGPATKVEEQVARTAPAQDALPVGRRPTPVDVPSPKGSVSVPPPLPAATGSDQESSAGPTLGAPTVVSSERLFGHGTVTSSSRQAPEQGPAGAAASSAAQLHQAAQRNPVGEGALAPTDVAPGALLTPPPAAGYGASPLTASPQVGEALPASEALPANTAPSPVKPAVAPQGGGPAEASAVKSEKHVASSPAPAPGVTAPPTRSTGAAADAVEAPSPAQEVAVAQAPEEDEVDEDAPTLGRVPLEAPPSLSPTVGPAKEMPPMTPRLQRLGWVVAGGMLLAGGLFYGLADMEPGPAGTIVVHQGGTVADEVLQPLPSAQVQHVAAAKRQAAPGASPVITDEGKSASPGESVLSAGTTAAKPKPNSNPQPAPIEQAESGTSANAEVASTPEAELKVAPAAAIAAAEVEAEAEVEAVTEAEAEAAVEVVEAEAAAEVVEEPAAEVVEAEAAAEVVEEPAAEGEPAAEVVEAEAAADAEAEPGPVELADGQSAAPEAEVSEAVAEAGAEVELKPLELGTVKGWHASLTASGARVRGTKLEPEAFLGALAADLAPGVQACIDSRVSGQSRRTDLEGRILFRMNVRRSGKTSGVRKIGGTITDSKLIYCVWEALEAVQLTDWSESRIVRVRVPVSFARP